MAVHLYGWNQNRKKCLICLGHQNTLLDTWRKFSESGKTLIMDVLPLTTPVKRSQPLTHFFYETSLSFILGTHKEFCEELKGIFMVRWIFGLFKWEENKRFDPSKGNLFSQSKSCFFSAELVSLSSLYSVSRASPIHPPWWKINWHSGGKVRMAILSVLQSESIHSLLCSQSLHFHRQSSGKELRGKKLAPAVAMKSQASLQERIVVPRGDFPTE